MHEDDDPEHEPRRHAIAITFYDSAQFGGFSNNFTITLERGPQAFGGTTSALAFQNATHSYDTDQENGGETLKITDQSAAAASVSAAPKPGTWALMMQAWARRFASVAVRPDR